MVKGNNDIENQIRKKYQEIELGHSAICDRCKEQYDNLSRPIGLWFVGNRFVDNKYRILFIGKNARGEPGEPDGAFMNQFNFVRNCYGIRNGRIGVIRGQLQKKCLENVMIWKKI
jgi:hypothetical protein